MQKPDETKSTGEDEIVSVVGTHWVTDSDSLVAQPGSEW